MGTKTWDVVTVGGGIIGLSLAIEIRERGGAVLVLDGGEPGREASAAAAGMLAPADPETPSSLREFARWSAQLYPEFVRKIEDRSGITVDFRKQGSIVFHHSADELPEHRRISLGELQQLEPSIQPPAGDGVFLLEGENSVDPDKLMRAMIETARNLGVDILAKAKVDSLVPMGSSVEVSTAIGKFAASSVVNCRGAWAGASVRPRKGQMLYLQPEEELLSHVVRARVYLVPRSSGKILVGATVEDVGFDKTVETRVIEDLHRQASDLIPALAAAPVVQSWAGLRPGTPDDLPVLGNANEPRETESSGRGEMGQSRIYLAEGHFRNGILLAPATARVIASLIEGKKPEIDISAFSPTRFS
ncbi:MAG TPA: glycine oxidase ThiO [Candidatus Angelobacter sp.]|nr:glycine oxidase ThiO [Candidatus Angelobacter sp.]